MASEAICEDTCPTIDLAMMQPTHVITGTTPDLVLSCEHASCAIPVEYDDLGLEPEQIRDHIGWDIGAGSLTQKLANGLESSAILGGISRLVVDCNRDLNDFDLIVAESDGVVVPGNLHLTSDERACRIREFHVPFHDSLDETLDLVRPALLLSIHSFTPTMHGRERRFDVGVLFDLFETEAVALGRAIERRGLSVRYNQPYSGLDGLIYSARRHGTAHGILYLELEVNNARLRTEAAIDDIAQRLVPAIREFIAPIASGKRNRRARTFTKRE